MTAANGDGALVYRIFNQGEIPALADGWRSVIALTPGRKWITIIDWTTLETARLELAAWQKLKPQPHRSVKLRTVRSVMRRRLKYVTPTQALKDAVALIGGDSPVSTSLRQLCHIASVASCRSADGVFLLGRFRTGRGLVERHVEPAAGRSSSGFRCKTPSA